MGIVETEIDPGNPVISASEFESLIPQNSADRHIGKGTNFKDTTALNVNLEDSGDHRHMLTYADGARHDGRTVDNGYRLQNIGTGLAYNGVGAYHFIFKGVGFDSAGHVFVVGNGVDNMARPIAVGCLIEMRTNANRRLVFANEAGFAMFLSTVLKTVNSQININGKFDEMSHNMLVGKSGQAVSVAQGSGNVKCDNTVVLWPSTATSVEFQGTGYTGDYNLGTDDGTAALGGSGANNEDLDDNGHTIEDFITDYTAGAEDLKRKDELLENWLVPDLRAAMEALVGDPSDIEDVFGLPSSSFTLFGPSEDLLLVGPEQVPPVVDGDGRPTVVGFGGGYNGNGDINDWGGAIDPQ